MTIDGERFELEGRESVFAAVTDFAYAPRDAHVEMQRRRAASRSPPLRPRAGLEPRYVAAEDVPVELRGAGNASRQVNNFASVEAFECDALIAVEVLTPERQLVLLSAAPARRARGDLLLRGRARRLRLPARLRRHGRCSQEVRTGDVIDMPCGYHGPSMAAPGYDLYYLNVMAGTERAWNFVDDPAHAWIRGSGPIRSSTRDCR